MKLNNVELTVWQELVLKEALKDAEVKYGQTLNDNILKEMSNKALVSIRTLNLIMDLTVEENED